MKGLSVARIEALLGSASAEELPTLLSSLAGDERAGVVACAARASRRHARTRAEHARVEALAKMELDCASRGLLCVAGVDEVGRGALAGPVMAAACVFEGNAHVEGLNDSKKLTPESRAVVSARIRSQALAFAIGHADPGEIDQWGIAGATRVAMRRALDALSVKVDHVLVDGLPVDLGIPSTSVVKGDALVRAIAAASVIAKVTRDALMVELDSEYPGYGFAGNKGYGSADHLSAIASLGPSPVHRMSFAPCSQTPLF